MLDQIRPYLAIDYRSTSAEALERQAELDARNARDEAAAAAVATDTSAVRRWLRTTPGHGAASPPPQRYYGWGTGPVVDSYTLLYRANGSAPRTPGAYHVAGPGARRTRESVHPVVGWRMHAAPGGYRPLGLDAVHRRGKAAAVQRRPRAVGRGWEYMFPGGGGAVLPEYRMRPDDKARVLAYDGAEPTLQEQDIAWYRALGGRPSFERLAVTDLHPAGDVGVDAEHLGADEHAKAYLAKLDRENGYRSAWSVDGKRVRCPDSACK